MKILLVLVFLQTTLCYGNKERITLLESTLKGIEVLTELFHDDYATFGPDALVGIVIAESAVRRSLYTVRKNKPHFLTNKHQLIRRIETIHLKLRVARHYMGKRLAVAHDAVGNISKALMQHPWVYQHYTHPLNKTNFIEISDVHFLDQEVDVENMETTERQKCTLEIVQCKLSVDCIKKSTAEGYFAYTLNHQALYFVFAKHLNCNMSSQMAEEKLSVLLNYFSDIMYQAMSVISRNKFPKGKYLDTKDLFFESGMLAGVLGLEDVFSNEWIKTALTWISKKEKCIDDHYGKVHFYEKSLENFFYRYFKRRQKRDSKFVGDCGGHMNGLALAYFSLGLEHMLK